MPKFCIKKSFSDIGEIVYKTASSKAELEGAMSLIYKEYLMRGFILPENYKSKLRITLHNILPQTATFVGLRDNKVVITNSVIVDSPLGLPMDMGYKKDVDKLRRTGRKICEGGYLAIDTELFGRGHFSMFNFDKLDFMFTIFKLMFQYALFYKKLDDLCIVTNPRYMIFKFLPFTEIGKVRYYGYDKASIKKKAAVPKKIDLKKIRENIDNPDIMRIRKVLYKLFLGDRLPDRMFMERYRFTPEGLRYFFVRKSDVLEKATLRQKKYIKSCYSLSEEEFNDILFVK